MSLSPLLLSALVGVLLAFVLLRSFQLATLVLVVANYTTLLAVALVPITHGSMNMVLVVMPTLLLVLTVSAAIHVANYWKHTAYKNMRTAVAEAVGAPSPCRRSPPDRAGSARVPGCDDRAARSGLP